MKVVRLSALHSGHLYCPGNIPGTHFCYEDSVTERIMLMKNSNDTIGNRTRDLPVCSAVPQTTMPPSAPQTQNTVVYQSSAESNPLGEM
jgi:hypothetical protein